MSDASSEGDITVAVGEVTVTKTYEPDRFPVPAMAFGIRSDRTEPTTVRVIEPIPDAVPTDDLGFHPEYGSEYWSIEGENAIFEREFGPEEEYLTVYGIRNVSEDRIDLFMIDPVLEAAGESTRTIPPGEGDPDISDEATGDESLTGELDDRAETDPNAATHGRADATTTDATDDAPTTDTTTDPPDSGVLDGESATDTTGSGAADSSGSAVDVADRTDDTSGPGAMGSASETADVDAASSEPAGTSTEPTIGAGGVAGALAAELRAGDVDTEDRELLADELSHMDQNVDVRIKHLQSEVSDLAAYSDALGEFIDENGPARELLDELTARIGELDDRVGEHDDRIEETAADLESIEARTGDAEAEIEDLDARASDHDVAIEALEERTETNATDVDAIEERLATTEERLDAVEERLSEVEGDADAAHDEIEALNEELAELQSWRSQISEVLGGVDDDA